MYIKVKVQTGARREEVIKIKENEYRISVKEPAKHNMANMRVQELLAKELGVNIKSVRLINGHHSPSKIFSVMI